MRRNIPGPLVPLLAALSLAACDPGSSPAEATFASALAVTGILGVDMAGTLAAAEGPPQPGVPPATPEASVFRDLTLQALAGINGDLARLREPLEAAAADADPDAPDPDRRTWQAPAPGGEVRLEVVRLPGPWFTLSLAIRPSAPADAPWRALLAGTYTPAGDPGDGQGALWADLAADLDDATAGKILLLWSRDRGARELSLFGYGRVSATDDAQPRDSTSRFRESPDGSGDLVFQGPVTLPAADGSVVVAPDALIYSRWNPGAEGRVDVKVAGSVAQAQGYADELAVQCWKTHGKVTTFDAVEATPGKSADASQKSADDARDKADKPGTPAAADKPEKVVIKQTGRVEDCPFLEPADAQLPGRPAQPPSPTLPEDLS